MLEVDLAIPFWLELAAALTGGFSGAMSAVRARYDIFGTICIACTAGLFGGIMRDLLLQNYGIYAFQKPELILSCAIAGVIVFFFGKLVSYLDPIVDLLDNLSCGLWAVISVGKGLSAGLDIVPAIILGTVTAVGGGVMRDVFMNKQPEAFQAGALYGSASLIGATAYALMKQNHILEDWAAISCIALILIVRYASLIFGLHTKPATDYSYVVTDPVKAVARKVHPPKSILSRKKNKGDQEPRVKRSPEEYERYEAFKEQEARENLQAFEQQQGTRNHRTQSRQQDFDQQQVVQETGKIPRFFKRISPRLNEHPNFGKLDQLLYSEDEDPTCSKNVSSDNPSDETSKPKQGDLRDKSNKFGLDNFHNEDVVTVKDPLEPQTKPNPNKKDPFA